MYVGKKKTKSVYLGKKIVKAIYLGSKVIWKRVIDTPITLLASSKSFNKGTAIWPGDLSAKIYENIDMSLYRGIEVYVNGAYISANYANNGTNIDIVATNDGTVASGLGSVRIASCYNNNITGEISYSSAQGTTVTFDFTADEGFIDLYVIGHGGGTTDGGNWSLSNAILLAR